MLQFKKIILAFQSEELCTSHRDTYLAGYASHCPTISYLMVKRILLDKSKLEIIDICHD